MGYIQSCRYRGPLDFIHLVSGLQQMIEAGQDRELELTTTNAEDLADLRAILRLIETRAVHEAAKAIDGLDTLVRDQIPTRLYDAVVTGSRRLGHPSATDLLDATPDS